MDRGQRAEGKIKLFQGILLRADTAAVDSAVLYGCKPALPEKDQGANCLVYIVRIDLPTSPMQKVGGHPHGPNDMAI